MSRSGHLYFVDEYRGQLIYLSKRHRWRGFSHGGTLRTLVERIAEYVRTGEPMDRWPIAPKRSMDGGFDMWGYGDEACAAVQAEAFKIPMFKDAS
ncbi:hypothetical protein RBI14_15385 [Alcaligenaceae bacterium B3P038]|nr:hypothetical protein [Alcaligenaceae bacterium B3P038]